MLLNLYRLPAERTHLAGTDYWALLAGRGQVAFQAALVEDVVGAAGQLHHLARILKSPQANRAIPRLPQHKSRVRHALHQIHNPSSSHDCLLGIGACLGVLSSVVPCQEVDEVDGEGDDYEQQEYDCEEADY